MKAVYLEKALPGRGLDLEVSRWCSVRMIRKVPESFGSLEAFYLESSRSRGFDLDHLGIFYLESSRSRGFDLDYLGIFYLESSR